MGGKFTDVDTKYLKAHIGEVVEDFFIKRNLDERGVVVNHEILNFSIDSAIVDLERMCEFHIPGESRPDKHKYAGFFPRWIAKTKPLQLCCVTQSKPIDIELNAELAVYIMQSFIRYIPNEVIGNLKYSFLYRDERGETLSLLAYCFENMPERY